MTTEPFDPMPDPDVDPADVPEPDAPDSPLDSPTADPIAPMDPDQTRETPDTDSGLA